MDQNSKKAATLDRFSDPQLDKLSEFLDQYYGRGAMDLEELDGFFTALHCCPEPVMPSEYLPHILCDVMEEGFSSLEEAQEVLGLIARYWNAVGKALQSDDVFMPLLLEDENGKARGNSWASGFMCGVELRTEA